MENAIDALKIAAAVLVFVLALSITINAFGEVRQASQVILDSKDREYDYTYVEENKDASGNVVTTRIVGVETIIPSIYKAYKENYKIRFSTEVIGTDGIYRKKDNAGKDEVINYIDLEKEVLGSDTQKEKFIKAILYGKNDDFDKVKLEFQTNLGIYLNDVGLYDKIKKNRFVEKLGIYYQEEVSGGSLAPDANKTQKRVITYED